MSSQNDFDMNNDGKIDEHEIEARKMISQKRMAWVALASMIVFTIILFLPVIPESRLEKLTDISDLFYISMAGIVGAFMGVSAWMARKK